MLEKFTFIFKEFKKASKYAQMYNKCIQNPFLSKDNKQNLNITEKTYIWVEKFEESDI